MPIGIHGLCLYTGITVVSYGLDYMETGITLVSYELDYMETTMWKAWMERVITIHMCWKWNLIISQL